MNKYIHLLMIAAFVILTFSSCSKEIENDTKLENMILSKIKEEAPKLGTMESIYTVLMTNYKKNTIRSDEYYIKEKRYKVSYGYDINEIKLKIDKERKILFITLPKAKEINGARNGEDIIQTYRQTHEGYKPLDANGQIIDVDKYCNDELDKLLKKYGEKNIKETNKRVSSYFSRIAQNLGLILNLQYEK